MCCNVETCCCCVDHKGGVKAIGLIFSLLILISLIASIVMLENRKAAINECADQAKASNGGVFCFDGTAIVEQSEAIAVQAWWADYYGYIMAANVVIQVIALLPNLGLVMAVVNGNRCLMLPWLILYMIYIVLWGIGLIPLIYLVVVVSAVAAAFGGLPQWQLILYTIGYIVMFGVLIYFWVVVQSLFKKMSPEAESTIMSHNRVGPNRRRSFDNDSYYEAHKMSSIA